MLINEVCKRCGLTKKAIEYYEEQGLTRPQIMENGYRVFSEDDVIQLNKIAVLRKRFWQRMTIYLFKLYATRKNWKFRIYKRNNNYSICLRETRIGRMPGRN